MGVGGGERFWDDNGGVRRDAGGVEGASGVGGVVGLK